MERSIKELSLTICSEVSSSTSRSSSRKFSWQGTIYSRIKSCDQFGSVLQNVKSSSLSWRGSIYKDKSRTLIWRRSIQLRKVINIDLTKFCLRRQVITTDLTTINSKNITIDSEWFSNIYYQYQSIRKAQQRNIIVRTVITIDYQDSIRAPVSCDRFLEQIFKLILWNLYEKGIFSVKYIITVANSKKTEINFWKQVLLPLKSFNRSRIQTWWNNSERRIPIMEISPRKGKISLTRLNRRAVT